MERADGAGRLQTWLDWVYEGRPLDRTLAVRLLLEKPHLFVGDPWIACAIGDDDAVEDAVSRDEGWANRAGGALGMPPLVAVTHSRLIQEAGFEERLLACARRLLRSGADPDGAWVHPQWPDAPLSALYGAAGKTHNAAMTRLLLEAGASPNDHESLYHSVESRDSICTRLLLDAGARVAGTNAIGRVLDYDKLDDLRLMLQHGGDARESLWMHHAILRGRSMAHVQLLADAGADLRSVNKDGISLLRWAVMHGRVDVVDVLRVAGVQEPLADEDAFVAACARGDEPAARALLQRVPAMFSRLTTAQLKTMPELADVGDRRAVASMLAVGWPLEVQAAWGASSLNLAVYRGDAAMTELLLMHGADWQARHGFGDNVVGTLSFASQAENMEDPSPRDYVGCARVLLTHGMPLPAPGAYTFSPEVAAFFAARRSEAT